MKSKHKKTGNQYLGLRSDPYGQCEHCKHYFSSKASLKKHRYVCPMRKDNDSDQDDEEPSNDDSVPQTQIQTSDGGSNSVLGNSVTKDADGEDHVQGQFMHESQDAE
jgi:hypothetical protein